MALPADIDSPPHQGGRYVARLAGVGAGYGRAVVLRDLDFEARAGELALVIGPTAAGKSSFVHLLRLALTPREGRMQVLGADATRLAAKARARLKRRIGYVAEAPTFMERASAYANIALPLRIAGRKHVDYDGDVRDLIGFVGLNAAAEEPVWRLSAVERRRVALARALAAKPDLILADAPTAGLSRGDAQRLIRLLAELRRVGAGIVVTSQDEALADGLEDPVVWRLNMGRLTPAEPPAHREAAE